MKSIRSTLAGLTLVAAAAGTAGTTIPAGAHAGHAAPMIKIDRPAAGAVYVNDVQQGGSVQQVGNLVKPAVSFGKTLTIKVDWECPPRSTGARIVLQVRNSNGAVVYDAGLLFTGPSGSATRAWTASGNGTYKIEAQVTCTHVEPGPNGPVSVVDGADGDSRDVIVITD